MQQGSIEWFEARIGKFTASEIYRLMTDPKGSAEFSKGAMSYIIEKASERITGYSNRDFNSDAMAFGNEQEPKARMIYEIETGKTIQEVGFYSPMLLPYFGASADGLIPGERGIEIKCPYETSQALKLYLCKTSDELKKENPGYWWQCQAGMLAYDLPVWDFICYDILLYEKFGLKVLTIERDSEDIAKMCERLSNSNKKVEEIIKSLQQ